MYLKQQNCIASNTLLIFKNFNYVEWEFELTFKVFITRSSIWSSWSLLLCICAVSLSGDLHNITRDGISRSWASTIFLCILVYFIGRLPSLQTLFLEPPNPPLAMPLRTQAVYKATVMYVTTASKSLIINYLNRYTNANTANNSMP